MARTRIQPTEELLNRLVKAQAEHTAAILTDPYNTMADDWGDDTNSALDVMRALFEMTWDQCDLQALDLYLNTTQGGCEDDGMINLPSSGGLRPHLGFCACDGICPALYELQPIALDN